MRRPSARPATRCCPARSGPTRRSRRHVRSTRCSMRRRAMTDTVQVGQEACATIMRDAVDRVIETQVDNIAAAAELITKSLLADGVIQLFATGHSRSFAME